MANQTVTTVVNYDSDSILGLLNGETLTINGGSVTVDSDVRWNQQAAVFHNVTISSSLGGSFLIDGTKVWEVPFSSSTGNVPSQASIGSNTVTGGTSGATGELLRVWGSGLLPSAAGGSMPTSGYIKLRSKTGTFQSGETITLPGGATIVASSAGRRSWIHVVARQVAGTGCRISVPRLGNHSIIGDWFELGTTNGSDGQTFQFPVTDVCPAIWIETSPSSGVYEPYLNAGSKWGTATQFISTDVRGKFFGIDAATGVITIARRSSNACGYKPASGCKVRIGNVILSQADVSDYDVNVVSATVGHRVSWTTTAGSALLIRKATCNWYFLTSAAFSIDLEDSVFLHVINIGNTSSTTNLTRVAIGLGDDFSSVPITMSACFSGGTWTDVRACRYASTTGGTMNVMLATDSSYFTFVRCQFECLGNTTTVARAATAHGVNLNRVLSSTMTDCVFIGCQATIASCITLSITGTQFCDIHVGETTTTVPLTTFAVSTGSKDITIDGLTIWNGLTNVHPYTAILSTATAVQNLVLKNIGTPDDPFNMGSASATGVIATCANSLGLSFRRLYCTNSRTSPFNTSNSCQDIIIANVWGDYADSQGITFSNTIVKGCKWTNSVSSFSSVYGRHWEDAFTSETTGRILIICNEPLAATAAECVATLASGSGWTSVTGLSMATIGDSVTWECSYFVLGITGLANSTPTVTGTNQFSNHYYEFQYDLGSGYNGTWLELTGTNLSGVGSIDPDVGIRLKVRATATGAAANNLISYIRIDTVTDATSQKIQYPLPGSILNISGLVPQSRVKILRSDNSALLAQQSCGAGTTLTFDLNYTGTVTVVVRNSSSSPTYKEWQSQISISPLLAQSLTALQEQD